MPEKKSGWISRYLISDANSYPAVPVTLNPVAALANDIITILTDNNVFIKKQ